MNQQHHQTIRTLGAAELDLVAGGTALEAAPPPPSDGHLIGTG